MNVAQEFEWLHAAALSLELDSAALDDVCAAALVTITQTHGSTFRRAGASMLVLRDGRLVCELSGGCPQRDIALRAQLAMESRQPALVRYGRDANYDVMLETGCGGELEVLIEPWREPADRQFLDVLATLRTTRQRGAMATVYAVDDQLAPQRLVHSASQDWSNIHDALLQQKVRSCMSSMAGTRTSLQRLELAGRHYHVLLESLEPSLALVIVGDGVGARMLAGLSQKLGWATTLVHPAETIDDLPENIHQVIASPTSMTDHVAFDELTAVVLMTHRLERDMAYLAALVKTPVSYIGVIGSRQRASQIHDAFPHESGRLHAPAGLDIGSETPQETALAIAAEILAMRHGRTGHPLVHTLASIHP